jgi:transposase
MKTYSTDLRERVLIAVDLREETQLEIAERFGVSRAWIGKMLKQRRETGSLAPLPHGGGRPAKYAGKDLEKLQAEVNKQPDATLEELRLRTGALGSFMAVNRALKKLKARLKKSPSGRLNKIGQMSSESASASRRSAPPWIRTAWWSMTKARPKPT